MADASPFAKYKALIVDHSASNRHALQLALAHLGVGKIVQAPRVVEARRAMAQRKFDIILCDYNFDHGPSGREFFDELRRTRALPLSTIFIMVTGEATLAKVVDVVESAPDDYLLKPVTSATLEQRLRKALAKKEALAPLYAAFEKEDFAAAIEVGRALLARKPALHPVDVSRLVAQAHLALGQVDQAVALYDDVLAQRAVPWSRVGFHGRKDAEGAPIRPGSALKNLVAETGDYLDAYDKLARLRAQEGRFSEALDIYERALKVSPNDVTRLQVAGQLAFCLGQPERALPYLDRAVRTGARDAAFDPRSMLHLAMIHHDHGEADGVRRMQMLLDDAVQREPENFRLGVLSKLVGVCGDMVARQLGRGVEKIREVAFLGVDERMTFELACDMLSMLDRMFARDIRTDLDQWVAQLARRFAVSSQASALMADLFQRSPPLAEVVRENAATIQNLANEGMKLLVEGKLQDASKRLLDSGEDTLNARLLAIACAAAGRFAETGEDESIARAGARAYDLIERFGESGLHLPGELLARVQAYAAACREAFTAPVTEKAQLQP